MSKITPAAELAAKFDISVADIELGHSKLRCRVCSNNKNPECFYKDNNYRSGYKPYCKDCLKEKRIGHAKS